MRSGCSASARPAPERCWWNGCTVPGPSAASPARSWSRWPSWASRACSGTRPWSARRWGRARGPGPGVAAPRCTGSPGTRSSASAAARPWTRFCLACPHWSNAAFSISGSVGLVWTQQWEESMNINQLIKCQSQSGLHTIEHGCCCHDASPLDKCTSGETLLI